MGYADSRRHHFRTAADVAPQPVWGSPGYIASLGKASVPRSGSLYPDAKDA